MARPDDKKWKGAKGAAISLENDPKVQFLDQNATPRTTSLFYEHQREGLEPMYTLRPYPINGIPSLRQAYMAERDLTGYIFAEKYLYNYKHFIRLKSSKVIGAHIAEWEEELEILIRAESVSNLIKLAQEEGNLGMQAAKFIASKGYDKAGKGRPSKEDINKEAKRQVRLKEEVASARERIKLKSKESSS